MNVKFEWKIPSGYRIRANLHILELNVRLKRLNLINVTFLKIYLHGNACIINFIGTIQVHNFKLCVLLWLMTMCVNFFDTIPPIHNNTEYFVQDFKFSFDHNGPIWSIISNM